VEIVPRQRAGTARDARLHAAEAALGLNDLFVTLHLPWVFEYRWAGGSLAAVEEAPSVDYAWEIPTPGKKVALHQQLVSSFASVQVAYTVDLAKSYYR
jgi:hypothetical protein